MIVTKKVLSRRDSTLSVVPFYPVDVCGRDIRFYFKSRGVHRDVADSDSGWSAWMDKLVKLGWLMRTRDGYYARPRTKDDLAHAYKRKQAYIRVPKAPRRKPRNSGGYDPFKGA